MVRFPATEGGCLGIFFTKMFLCSHREETCRFQLLACTQLSYIEKTQCLGMVVHAYYPQTPEAEGGGL